MTFHVLHTHPVGFSDDTAWDSAAGDYPYRADALSDAFSPSLSEKVVIASTLNMMEAELPDGMVGGLAMQALGSLFGTGGAPSDTWAEANLRDD